MSDYIDVPAEELKTSLLGWCQTGHHETCRGIVPAQRYRSHTAPALACSCPCHYRESIRVEVERHYP